MTKGISTKIQLPLFTFFTCLAILSYENMLLYLFALTYLIYRNEKTFNNIDGKSKLKAFLLSSKKFHIIIFISIAYITSYYIFSTHFTSNYEGVNFSVGSFFSTFDSLFRLTGASFAVTLLHIRLKNISVFAVLTIIILLAAFFVTTYKSLANKNYQLRIPSSENARKGSSSKLILTTFAASFIPNLLFVFTERYRNWAHAYPLYLGALPSTMVLTVTIWLFLMHFSKRLALLKVLLISLLIFSIANTISNVSFWNSKKVESNKVYEARVISKRVL
jgi:hypothetical protein